jgi:S-methylmethionine-dependent homocysteine/selenocysteine methylase
MLNRGKLLASPIPRARRLEVPKYRHALPQLAGDKLFLTDGGLETDLIFRFGMDLPHFAAISLFFDDDEPVTLRDYLAPYLAAAKAEGRGFLLESATWRSSPDWLNRLGIAEHCHADLNRKAIDFLLRIREAHETVESPMPISGQLGPRGDGYAIDATMTPDEAAAYHSWQAKLFAETEADQISALTMNYVEEALGVARAGAAAGIPTVLSFTVETDGRLPSGQPLGEAIEQVDAESGNAPAYFMLNCAHPDHFSGTLRAGDAWVNRIRAIRANASRMSHEELDKAEELDSGNPEEFGHQHAELLTRFPSIKVMGGCCGTDHRHVEEINKACA